MIRFVGAGPGDIELITVKGMKALSAADCIIYAGSLVNEQLLGYAKEGCKFFNSASMTLEEVISQMLANEQHGLDTVRLHTGDPSLYGAIREQIDMLVEQGVEYQVIPGVSSFSGAAAALGAEYTLNNVSQTLILTRMAGRTPVPDREGIQELAKIQASMAIFLSSGMLDELSANLIAGGYRPDTPAAIAYKVSWPDELLIRTTVSGLAKAAAEADIHKTALILVGDFLGDSYQRSFLYNPQFSHGYRAASAGGSDRGDGSSSAADRSN